MLPLNDEDRISILNGFIIKMEWGEVTLKNQSRLKNYSIQQDLDFESKYLVLFLAIAYSTSKIIEHNIW